MPIITFDALMTNQHYLARSKSKIVHRFVGDRGGHDHATAYIDPTSAVVTPLWMSTIVPFI